MIVKIILLQLKYKKYLDSCGKILSLVGTKLLI